MPLPSKRDRDALRTRLAEWLAAQLPPDAKPDVSPLAIPEGNGLSSETLLFDATWTEDGERRAHALVARMSPDMTDWPTFPEYDLALQVDCLRIVRARSDVPVPEVAFFERSADVLGAPFFVMHRVDGVAPTDMPPYPFDGWLLAASAEERARVERSSIGILADLHAIEVDDELRRVLDRPRHGATALDQHLAYQRAYYEWAREGTRFPTIERTFAWLEAHRPSDPGEAVLNWGDARIGNVLYRDFAPVAVLDWEMAALGPREVDLAWMVQMNHFFQSLAEAVGVPGLPDFLTKERAIAIYEERTGHRVRDFDWYFVFGALRFMIISTRTSARAVAYGQMEAPASPDELLINRNQVEPYVG